MTGRRDDLDTGMTWVPGHLGRPDNRDVGMTWVPFRESLPAGLRSLAGGPI